MGAVAHAWLTFCVLAFTKNKNPLLVQPYAQDYITCGKEKIYVVI